MLVIKVCGAPPAETKPTRIYFVSQSKSKDDEQHVLMFLKPHNNLQISNLACATGDWRNSTTETRNPKHMCD
jgi:hypothetical protein